MRRMHAVPLDNGTTRAQPALMRLGMALKRERTARGLTQPQLAELSSLTQSTLSRTEAGTHDPTVSEIVALEQAMGLTLGFLLVAGGFVEGLAAVPLAIMGDKALSDRERDWLLAAYQAAVTASRPRKRTGGR